MNQAPTPDARAMFGSFLYGPFPTVDRTVKQLSKKWAKHYKNSSNFPACPEIAATSGSLVITNEIADLARNSAHWRVYFVRPLGSGIAQELEWQDHKNVLAAFESQMLQCAWGALDYVIGHVAPNALENVTSRLEALAQFWCPLEALRYIYLEFARPVSLQEMVARHYAILFEYWCTSGNIAGPNQLIDTVAAMRRATAADVETAIKEALLQLTKTDSRVKNRAALFDKSSLESLWSEILTSDERADLTGFHIGALRRAMYTLDEALVAKRP